MKSIKDVVKCAKINSNNIATKKFKEVRKRVPEWIQNDNKLLSMKEVDAGLMVVNSNQHILN